MTCIAACGEDVDLSYVMTAAFEEIESLGTTPAGQVDVAGRCVSCGSQLLDVGALS